jgi:Kef-type K+ transport system membrane component KefB
LEFLGLHIDTGSVESTAFTFGLILVFGVIGGRVARKVGLPAITGYLVFGILINPKVSGIVTVDAMVHVEELVTPIALSIIAYLIGGSLRMDTLRGLGRSVFAITLAQGLAPFIFVFLIITFLVPALLGSYLPEFDTNSYLAMGLVAGAISLATAPAAVIAVLHELKAKGPLTNTILAVVAIDDALAVVMFALVAGFSSSLINSGGTQSVFDMISHPVVEIVFSLILGLIFAFILIYVTRFIRQQRVQTILAVLGMVVVCGGVATYLGLSIILANMAFGFVVVNQMKHSRMIDAIVGIEDIVFVLFFTLAGATFLVHETINTQLLLVVGVTGSLIVLARCGGKFGGSWLGAKLSGAPEAVRKNLGFALMPKAGVSIGLAMSLAEKPEFVTISSILVSSLIVSTIINELIAPPLAKHGILKSGEGRTATTR